MIIRPRPGIFELFFILRGSIIQRVFPQILAIGALSALVVALHAFRPGLLPDFSNAPFALIGIALSIFLGFRNNACYDRWWEARKQWGQVIFTTRQFARQLLVVEHGNSENGEAERRRLVRLVIAFTHALVPHLRPGESRDAAEAFMPAELVEHYRTSRNGPDRLLTAIEREIVGLRERGVLADIPFSLLDRSIGDLAAAQAACERIRSTPVPFGYTLLLHRTAYLFCLLLPFALANAMGWLTPLAAALVAYAFFGLDALGDELEVPFGNQSNAVPIKALADTVEINLREALGETDLPELPAPRDYLLM